MTLYAGEAVEVLVDAANDFNGTALTDSDVTAMAVTIFDTDNTTELVTDEPMAYTTGEGWSFLWFPSSADAGDYQAKIVLTAVDASESVEWRRIRLAPNRAP